jgi:hypothetical protein
MLQINFTLFMKYSNWPVHISLHVQHQPFLDEHRSSSSRFESSSLWLMVLVYYNVVWVTKQLS